MDSAERFVADSAAAPDSRLKRATLEARAFMRVARLLPKDLEANVPRGIRDGEDVVVLVHGALATAGAWRPLRERLERRGVWVATFTYSPSRGVPEIAAAIAEVTRELPPHARIHLIGHSLGGLAVRWFVQEMPADARVVQTITVASPFAGARGARLLPGRAGRDMQAGSAVLERLAATAGRPTIPHLSIFGTADGAVPKTTTFAAGDRLVIPEAGHNMLLFHEQVAEQILARVTQAKA